MYVKGHYKTVYAKALRVINTVRRSGVKNMSEIDCREDSLTILKRIDHDLSEKRREVITYLKMHEAELRKSPEFVRFLVFTTDDLIERTKRLNSILRNLISVTLLEEQEMEDLLEKGPIPSAKEGDGR